MGLLDLLIPSIEIVIITIALYYMLSFFWHTRAMDLVLGLLAFLALYVFVNVFHFPVLQKLMLYVVNVAVIALLIIFQPELRFALSKLSVKGKRYREITEFDRFLEQMSQMIYRMAEKQVGVLIIIENQDSLEEYARKAIRLDADFAPELLEAIFNPSSPLHDGGVIIRGTTIVAASVILPLASDSSQITKSMGTRHRAGLGISQITDALIIVVSEENGRVSIAREGIITRGIKIDRFRAVLRSIFSPPEKTTTQKLINPLVWLKKWVS